MKVKSFGSAPNPSNGPKKFQNAFISANFIAEKKFGECVSMLARHLVYKKKIGVNYAPQKLPSKIPARDGGKELPDDRMCEAMAGDMPVML
jgi:hypothetical protein